MIRIARPAPGIAQNLSFNKLVPGFLGAQKIHNPEPAWRPPLGVAPAGETGTTSEG